MPETDRDFGNWLAGFVDGEGCFYFKRVNQTNLVPAFAIKVRADDPSIL